MNEAEFNAFIIKLKKELPEFVESLKIADQPGKYKLSPSGDVFENEHWGLANSTFATRILFTLNLIEKERENLVNYILSFKREDGFFVDPEIKKNNIFSRVKTAIKNLNPRYLSNQGNEMAETRQAFAALINLGYEVEPLTELDLTDQGITNYFKSQLWDNVWGASSQINHLLFFIKYSKLTEERKLNLSKLCLEEAINYKKIYFDKNQNNDLILIGGWMKLLMGLSLFNLTEKLLDNRIVDICLQNLERKDACEHFNTVYVLSESLKISDYKRKESIEKILNTCSEWKKYYHENYSGFSFNSEKSIEFFYGARVTKGLNQPDLHGTAMFLWGFLIASKVIDSNQNNLFEPIL